MLLGSHCSTAGGICAALERAVRIQAQSCQIFVKNNMQWAGKPIAPDQIAAFKARVCQTKLCVFGHSGYLINLASPAGPNRDKSISSLIQELELAASLDLPFLVLHPGAHLGAGEEHGVRRAVAGLDQAVAATKKLRIRIALENTAGQGSCLGHKLEHLGAILKGVKDPSRFCVCLDTAHLFAAGFDIRTARGWNSVIQQADSLFGIDQIVAFHLNDSKTELNSRLDRHAHIGQGTIGIDGFKAIVRDKRFSRHPACLETPKSDDLSEDVNNLKVLRGLLPRRVPSAVAPSTPHPVDTPP